MEWFKKSDAFDSLIRERFLDVYQQAHTQQLAHWRNSPLSMLALIIVCDQFPRNMFRESPRAFATDPMALDCAQQMCTMGLDLRLNAVERQFAYLPFEHAENLDAQHESIKRFSQLAHDHAQHGLLEWARKHSVIIERFGRFPHRNAVLARPSTPEELEFLEGPDSRF